MRGIILVVQKADSILAKPVGFPICFKIDWKKVLRGKSKAFTIVIKVLINSNSIKVLKRSKIPNIKWL